MPSSVIIAEVAGSTLNSSAANFNTAVNGVDSGTLSLNRWGRGLNSINWVSIGNLINFSYTLNGNLGSDVNVILNVAFLKHIFYENINFHFSSQNNLCFVRRFFFWFNQFQVNKYTYDILN